MCIRDRNSSKLYPARYYNFLKALFMQEYKGEDFMEEDSSSVLLEGNGDKCISTTILPVSYTHLTGWNYMAALKTVYAPLSRYRKIIIYGMQFIFFFAAVCVQNLLALGSLEFGMIILVFILMTFSPVVIEVITEWCRSLYNKAHEKEKKGIISLFLEKVQK